MKDLRIIFMGTPDFAVATLDAILQAGANVVAVITAPDKPAGRGRKLNQSAVKQYAVQKNIAILQPTNLKNEDFLNELANYKADLQIVVAFRMLPKQVWSMPKLGTFNLHASLLPDYRGAAPIHWAIMNGETKTGVTTFFINEKIDTGEILLQEEIEINHNTNVGELHNKLMVLGANLVVKTINYIKEGNNKTINQPEKDGKLAPKLNKENCKIDWNQSIHHIYNHIRGLNPYPTAWTTINNEEQTIEAKIYNVKKHLENHNSEIGKLICNKKQIKVAVTEGFIEILELKLAGKKKMDTQSLLNGYTFSNQAKML